MASMTHTDLPDTHVVRGKRHDLNRMNFVIMSCSIWV